MECQRAGSQFCLAVHLTKHNLSGTAASGFFLMLLFHLPATINPEGSDVGVVRGNGTHPVR